jgi:hypothetical protein
MSSKILRNPALEDFLTSTSLDIDFLEPPHPAINFDHQRTSQDETEVSIDQSGLVRIFKVKQ